MLELIQSIITKFGGRISGSQEEIDAQYYLKERLQEFCDKTEVQPFKTAIEAKFHSLKFFSAIYIINLILFPYYPTTATFFSFLNCTVFIGHFVMYFDWLDFLYPKKESLNVSGTVYPKEEIKYTILIGLHMDSVYEFKWWYKLKQTGAYLSVLSGFLFLIQCFFFLSVILFSDTHTYSLLIKISWVILLLCSPALVTFYDMHDRNRKVDGAIDNLSGVAIAYGIVKEFANSKLKHTAIRAVSFGCEEIGLKGSKAYARKINIDSIKNDQLITLMTAEIHAMKSYPKSLLEKMEKSFIDTNTTYKKNVVTVGITDGMSFVREGIAAITIVGIESNRLDETYHTRLDNMSNLDEKGLEAVKKAVIHFIKEWDKQYKN